MADEHAGVQQEVWDEKDKQVGEERTIVFEDVSAGLNSDQLIVSTNKDLISAKRVTAESGARQWTGALSDASLQQLSKDRKASQIAEQEIKDPQGAKPAARFNDVYGLGKKLPPT